MNTDTLIESMADFFADFGLAPTLGRIFGLLLITPHPLSLEKIAAELTLSKPAISVQIRRLETLQYCKRIPKKGDRKQYYRLNPNYLVDNLSLRMQKQSVWLSDFKTRLADLRSPAEFSQSVKSNTDVQKDDKREKRREQPRSSTSAIDGANTERSFPNTDKEIVKNRLQELIEFQEMMNKSYQELIINFTGGKDEKDTK